MVWLELGPYLISPRPPPGFAPECFPKSTHNPLHCSQTTSAGRFTIYSPNQSLHWQSLQRVAQSCLALRPIERHSMRLQRQHSSSHPRILTKHRSQAVADYPSVGDSHSQLYGKAPLQLRHACASLSGGQRRGRSVTMTCLHKLSLHPRQQVLLRQLHIVYKGGTPRHRTPSSRCSKPDYRISAASRHPP